MELKHIYNSIIPFKGYLALTVWPFVFIRKEFREKYDATADRHENTHGCQQIECFILGAVIAAVSFFIGCSWWSLIPLGLFWELYLIDWLIKLPICYVTNKDAYYSICFEQEAYEHEKEMYYNEVRHHFVWIKYIFKIRGRV